MNFDVLISARLIRQIKKKNVADVTYSFDEDRFTAENRLSSSTLRYEAVESLADCPGFYALFQQKNAALLIPKAGLPEGEQPVFAAFLQEKTGRVLRKYTQKPRKLFPRVLAALLLTALLIGAFIFLPHADELLNSRPQAFTKDGFSLTLTEAFTEEDAGGYCAFYAASQQAEVWVFTDDLTNYPYAPADAKAYAGEMAADYGEEGAPLQEGLLPNGAYYVAYTELWEDGSYYTVDAVFREDGVFTVVEFSCPKESRRFYEPRFLQWAQSVSLNSLLSL